MDLKEKDFIEIEFTGKIKDGEVFDSNIKEDIKKAELKTPAKPFVFALGQGMFLKGVDEFLIGKESNKKYHIELSPEKAFGTRDLTKIQLVPLNIFKQHKVSPFPGAVFNFDGKIAKILSVSGGRVRVDFNNPLAGKEVEYDVKVLRKIEDIKEKINSFNKFLFKKQFKLEIKDKKLILDVEKPLVKFVEMFKEKFKEIFELELEVKEIEVPIKKE